MKKANRYTEDFKAKMVDKFERSRDRTAFIRRSGVPGPTLYGWAAKARRPAAPAARRPHASKAVSEAEALPAMTVSDFAAALILYQELASTVRAHPRPVVLAVLTLLIRDVTETAPEVVTA